MSQRVLGRQLDSGDAKMNRLVTEAIPHPLGLRMMASRPTSSGHHRIKVLSFTAGRG